MLDGYPKNFFNAENVFVVTPAAPPKVLDEDGNDCIDKEEFVQLIMMVFDKMLENEIDLIKTINDRSKGHEHDHDHGHEHGHGHGHGHSHTH